jgi:hypothetical protein
MLKIKDKRIKIKEKSEVLQIPPLKGARGM